MNANSDWRAQSAPAPAQPAATEHTLEFTGSGSEYFRIWLVNLLLTLVTVGIYYPWAKVRKLRYFYGNTLLDGHAFDFHGDPKRMLRGYLLVGVLFVLYAFAGEVSDWGGVVALAIVAAIWPALLRASLRFRLAQTSWRGLRFQFTGDTAGAYRALLPMFVAVTAMIALSTLALPGPDEAAQAAPRATGPALFGFLFALLAMSALAPYTLWMLKRYQHSHYQVASVRTRFTAGAGAFYKLAGKASLLMLLAGVAAGVAFGLIGLGGGRAPAAGRFVALGLVMIAVYLAIVLTLQPYIVSRMQNLVWNRTESRSLGFRSELRWIPLMRLTAVNALLVVLTLGLYWPFAAVAMARLRVESVDVLARTELDALVARSRSGSDDAAGDAAGDLFGIDVGL